MKKLLLAGVVLTSLLTVACSTNIPVKSAEETAKALAFDAPRTEGKAGLYIYRPHHNGRNSLRQLFVDMKYVATSSECTFFFRELPAGKHYVATENRFGNYYMLSIDMEAGKNYYFKQDHAGIQSLFAPVGFDLQLMDEFEARATISKCNTLIIDDDGKQPDLNEESKIVN